MNSLKEKKQTYIVYIKNQALLNQVLKKKDGAALFMKFKQLFSIFLSVVSFMWHTQEIGRGDIIIENTLGLCKPAENPIRPDGTIVIQRHFSDCFHFRNYIAHLSLSFFSIINDRRNGQT